MPPDVVNIDENPATTLLPWDLDKLARVFDAMHGTANNVDMGAYENHHIAGCPWDLNGDGQVDTVDFLALLGAWGPNPGDPADFDCDNVVATTDFLALLEHWGPCPTNGQAQQGSAPFGSAPEAGEPGLTLEQALLVIGFSSVEDYGAWLEQASEQEASDSALLLAVLLGGG